MTNTFGRHAYKKTYTEGRQRCDGREGTPYCLLYLVLGLAKSENDCFCQIIYEPGIAFANSRGSNCFSTRSERSSMKCVGTLTDFLDPRMT